MVTAQCNGLGRAKRFSNGCGEMFCVHLYTPHIKKPLPYDI